MNAQTPFTIVPDRAHRPWRATEPDGRTWFEAETPCGAMRLCTPAGGTRPLPAALALQQQAVLLDALDAWIGNELDWQWIGTPTSPLATVAHTYAEWRADGDDLAAQPSLLEWPWALLRSLPRPPAALAQRLRWPHVGAVLVAAQWRIAMVELAELEVGGAVLLPSSFSADWRGLVRAGQEPAEPGFGAPVSLCAPASARVRVGPVERQPHPEADAAVWCEVQLDPLQALATDRLTGWTDAAIGDVEPQAGLWRCASEHDGARQLATGRLARWADGWALLLERVGDHAHGLPMRLV